MFELSEGDFEQMSPAEVRRCFTSAVLGPVEASDRGDETYWRDRVLEEE